MRNSPRNYFPNKSARIVNEEIRKKNPKRINQSKELPQKVPKLQKKFLNKLPQQIAK